MKKLYVFLLVFIIAFSPLTGCFYSYASGGSGGSWESISDEETLVAAFKAYCKRQNFDISHVPNTVKDIVKWDYGQLEKYCVLAGIDITGLNAHIWYKYQDSKLRFFFDSVAIRLLNQLYNSIINENNMSANSHKTVYSGKVYTDAANNRVYTFIVSGRPYFNSNSSVLAKGDKYIYTGAELKNYLNQTVFFPLDGNNSLTTTVVRGELFNNYRFNFAVQQSDQAYFYCEDGGLLNYDFINGFPCIIFSTATELYYFGVYHEVEYMQNGNKRRDVDTFMIQQLNNPDVTPANIQYNQGNTPEPIPENKSMEVSTDGDTINNYITNNNITNTYNYYDDDDPPGTPKPTPLPDTPDYPTGGYIGSDGQIHWSMPDLDIDWHLNLDFNNLPFPFSIPTDIINFLEVLDSEPVAPSYELEFTIFDNDVTVEIDLSFFDEEMEIIRGIILAGYCLFLIVNTRNLFHVY